MRRDRGWRWAGVLGVLCLAMAFATSADALTIQKPYEQYGHLYNTADGTSTGTPVGWCASTAVMNSFIYLENQYPGIFGNLLSRGDAVASRNELKDMMDPAYPRDVWEGKLEYLDTYAPGKAIVGGMLPYDTTGWAGASSLLTGWPSWDVMWEQLKACEDVELGIYDLPTTVGHMLTLTSMHLDDLDGDGTWDPGVETAQIDYLDPNNPTQLFVAGIQLDANGRIVFNWHNGGANTPRDMYIAVAYWESPIPEPATICLLALGGVAILIRKRKRLLDRAA